MVQVNFVPSSNIPERQQETGVRWCITPRVRCVHEPEVILDDTDLFIEWFTGHFLKHKASGKVILLSDGHRVRCNSPLLIQIAVENNVTITRLTSHYTHTLQPLDKWLFESLTFRHRASSILGQAFRCSPENAFYIFNQQIYFITWYLLNRASFI